MTSKPIKVQVQEYNLVDFIKTVCDLAVDGYTVSDTNEGYPRQYIGVFTCEMLLTRPSEEFVEPVKVEEEKPKGDPKNPTGAGRKPKNKAE